MTEPFVPSWAPPGWFDRASRWMTDRMTEAGRPPSEPPAIDRLVGISIILRATSADGPVFFKWSAPILGREAAITALLAETTPELVTPVLAFDPDENWLLMGDLGPRTIADGPPDTWARGLDVHAMIQRAWVGRTDALLRAGAGDRSLATLAAVLPDLAEHEPLASELTSRDRRAWREAVPRFVLACQRLDRLHPGATVVHGDLHPWNVADSPDGPRVFDWSDAGAGHPFLDLAVYATRTPDVGLRRWMRDAYLGHWAELIPPIELAEAGDLALIAGTLAQVDSYARLLNGLDRGDTDDLRGMAGSWARAAIDTLDEGIEIRNPGHADG